MNEISPEMLMAELRSIRHLLALNLIEGKIQREQIRLLGAASFDRHEIALLVGTTPGTVSVELSNQKKNGEDRAKPKQRTKGNKN